MNSSTTPADPSRILIVDDDPAVCHALASVLESEGYAVTTVFDGAAASREFYGRNFDLVLLDLNMPRKDGWATLERLTDIQPLLPVIIITARPGQEEIARRAGAAGFMEKPLDLESLLSLAAALLKEDTATRLQRVEQRAVARDEAAGSSCREPKFSWVKALDGPVTGGKPSSANRDARSFAA